MPELVTKADLKAALGRQALWVGLMSAAMVGLTVALTALMV